MYRHQPTQLNPTILFGGIPTPLKNRKSVGMILPNIWKNVPNHQSAIIGDGLLDYLFYTWVN